MKKLNLYQLAILLLFTFSGCFTERQKLSRLWFYTYSSSPNQNNDSLLTPASFLLLQKDGTYSRDFGKYDYGHWALNKSTIELTDSKNQVSSLIIKYTGIQDIQLLLPDGILANFDGQQSNFRNNKENPFSPENNTWRITPGQKENNHQLAGRLRNHCQFWETYFTWALNTGLATIDVRSTPTSIKIYGNGFTLKPFEELPAQWRACFFDEEDCRRANDIMKDIIQRHDIVWGHTDNKYKMFIGAFQQLERFLREYEK